MRFLFHSVILFLCAQPVLAQYSLKQTQPIADHYIVQFHEVENSAQQLRRNKRDGLKALRLQQQIFIERFNEDLRHTDLKILRNLWLKQALAIQISKQYLADIYSLSYVTELKPDQRYQVDTLGTTTLPISGLVVQDNLAELDIDSTWSAEYKGQGVVVAILDSGVDVEHEDLAGRYRGGTNSWFDAYQQRDAPIDLSGHGTAVGSIILGGDATGSYIGVAPNARWIAARIFDDDGVSTESAISETLQWVLDPDQNPDTDDYPDIVQNSWGLDATEGDCFNPFSTELAAIDALGIDIVFAVGNSGQDGYSSYLTPSFDSHVISVGAIDENQILLSSSSRGPNDCNSSITPSLAAPGKNIKAAYLTFGGFDTNNYSTNDGTSFSSPHVSGVLALLRSQFKAADHLSYRNAIYDTAFFLGSQDDSGRGLPQAASAVTLLDSQSIPAAVSEVNLTHAVHQFNETETNVQAAVIRSGDITTEATVLVQSLDGTAVENQDYQPVSTLLTFSAGDSIQWVDIVLISDATVEGIETFSLFLSENTNVNLGSQSTISISITDGSDAAEEEDEIGGSSSGIIELLLLGLLWVGRRFLR